MTDDIMTRVREWLASCVRVATENGAPEEADLEAAALAFIDGEPLRQAKALEAVRDENTSLLGELENDAARLAAAREEQREACALALKDAGTVGFGMPLVRATPLTATPLADEIAALRARVAELEGASRYLTERLDSYATRRDGTSATLADGIEAMRAHLDEYRHDWIAAEDERDALREQLLAERERMERWLTAPDGKQYERGTVQDVFDECDALRAEVGAARTLLEIRSEGWAQDVLRAMDEAKP